MMTFMMAREKSVLCVKTVATVDVSGYNFFPFHADFRGVLTLGISWYEFERGGETVTFPLQLSKIQKLLLRLLDIDPSAYA